MDWLEILYEIFKVCLIPLLGVLTTFAIKWLYAKEAEIVNKVDSDIADKYISMVFETVRDCVSATTQTYVDSLKKAGTFDAAAQKAALQMTLSSVLTILTDDAKEYLATAYGDVNTYLLTKIEAEVKAQK